MTDTDGKAAKARTIAQRIMNLPTLPTVVAKMIEMIDDPKTNAAKLSKLIETDQVLTAKVLKLANSAYYGLPRQIGSLNMAVVVIGFSALRNIVLGLTVVDRFAKNWNGYFDFSQFWEHAVACGIASKFLARDGGYLNAEEAFATGLLHDLGKLIFNQYLPEDFDEVVKIVREKRVTFEEAELEVIGISHAEVGGLLAEHWRLPNRLAEGIAFHHRPAEAPEGSLLPAIVHVADVVCHEANITQVLDTVVAPELNPEACRILGMEVSDDGEVDLTPLITEFHNEFERADTFIDLLRTPLDRRIERGKGL
jgi:putative nucleotidyltransferase with HDIG domain